MILKNKSFSHNQAGSFGLANQTTTKGSVFTLPFFLSSKYKDVRRAAIFKGKFTMKYKMFILLIFTQVTLKLSAQVLGKPPAQTIPQFEFFRMDSKPFTDKDLPKGKIIFFMFVDPDCDHCQNAMISIGEKYESFKKTAVFIVSISDPKKLNQFMTTYGSKMKGQKNVTLLQDKLGQFIIKFNPARYPSMLLYSPKGLLLDYEDNPESVFRLVNTINKNVR